MKKFLAVLVVLTLVAGAAFAELGFGGELGFKVDLAKGDTKEESYVTTGAGYTNARVDANLSGDSWGGKMRLLGGGTPSTGTWWVGGGPFAFLWWQPIDQLKIQMGRNMDSDWGAAQITGWGFNAEAQDYVAVDKDSGQIGSDYWTGRNAGFYPGYNGYGLGLSIYPAEGVAINIGLPFADADPILYKNLAKIELNAQIQIGEVGKLNLSFEGDNGLFADYNASAGTVYGSFYVTAIENVGVDLGVAYPLTYKFGSDAASVAGINPKGPHIGLGVKYDGGDFAVKFRAGMEMAGTTAVGDKAESTDQSAIGFNILPSFNLEGMKVFLNAGANLNMAKVGDKDQTITRWFVNPYVLVPAGGLRFYAGLKLFGESWSEGGPYKKPGATEGEAVTNWALPIGFQLYF